MQPVVLGLGGISFFGSIDIKNCNVKVWHIICNYVTIWEVELELLYCYSIT